MSENVNKPKFAKEQAIIIGDNYYDADWRGRKAYIADRFKNFGEHIWRYQLAVVGELEPIYVDEVYLIADTDTPPASEPAAVDAGVTCAYCGKLLGNGAIKYRDHLFCSYPCRWTYRDYGAPDTPPAPAVDAGEGDYPDQPSDNLNSFDLAAASTYANLSLAGHNPGSPGYFNMKILEREYAELQAERDALRAQLAAAGERLNIAQTNLRLIELEYTGDETASKVAGATLRKILPKGANAKDASLYEQSATPPPAPDVSALVEAYDELQKAEQYIKDTEMHDAPKSMEKARMNVFKANRKLIDAAAALARAQGGEGENS